MFFDAHIHLCKTQTPKIENWACIATFCFKNEWIDFFKNDEKNQNVFTSFGVHPQLPSEFDFSQTQNELDFLKTLLEKNAIFAIGEIGFDFFTQKFKETKDAQEKLWKEQISLAIEYEKPVVIHCRKAIERVFRDCAILKKLPAVIFHSFGGNEKDAKSILNRGVNAFFSFGKHQIFNEKKATISFLNERKSFENRIFFETDAPYQTLKGEEKTFAREIVNVYKKANEIADENWEEKTKNAAKKLFADCGVDFFAN